MQTFLKKRKKIKNNFKCLSKKAEDSGVVIKQYWQLMLRKPQFAGRT